MKIFLTNDDGIHAEGLWALYRQFSRQHTVTVVAPDRERSAVGHGITLHKPLRSTRVSINGGMPAHAVSGTPADCIKLGLLEIMETRPELVVSGINPGANVGVNINYSGTVCAAKEAALYGIPSIAVSIEGPEGAHYDTAARFALMLAEEVHDRGLPPGTFLNVNVPDRPLSEIAGVKISRQGTALFSEYIDKRVDPRNRTYYWQGCDAPAETENSEIDEAALSLNYISVTPIKCDATDYRLLEEMKGWRWGDPTGGDLNGSPS